MTGNKVDIEIVATDRTGPATKTAEQNLKNLGDEAKRTAVKMSDLQRPAIAAGRAADNMGDQFDGATSDAQQLAHALLELKAEISMLGNLKIKAPSVTGGGNKKGNNVSSLFGFTMTEIERFGGQAGVTMATSLGGGFGSAIKGVFEAIPAEAKLVIIAAGAAIGVTLAGAIGAATNGALLAGIGGIGIAGAIIAQAKDPKVVDAFGGAFENIKKQWTQVTSGFAGPLAYSAAILEKSAAGFIRIIAPNLQDLSGLLPELAAGVGALLKNAAPGFAKGLAAAKPILDALAKELPHFGEVLGDAFEELSEGATGAAYGLRTVFKIAETGIIAFATIVRVLSQMYEAFINLDTASADWGKDMLGSVPVLGGYLQWISDKLHQIKDGGEAAGDGLDETEAAAARSGRTARDTKEYFEGLRAKLDETAETASTLAAAMTDKLLDSLLSSDHAAIGFERSLDDLSKSIHDNGKSFDIHTEKGRQNKEAVLGVVEANKQIFDTMIANGATMDEATAAWNTNTDALKKQLKQAGLNDKQINELIGSYSNVPKQVTTNIALQGLTNAINDLADLQREINGIPRSMTVTIHTAISSFSAGLLQGLSGRRVGGIQGAATGGARQGMTWVGEEGPELVKLPSGSQVFTAAQSGRMAGGDGASQNDPSGYVIHNTIVLDNKVVGEAMSSLSRKGDLKVYSKSIV